MSGLKFFKNRNKYLVIIGCLLLTFVMGSIHAFSVLLETIEINFKISRTFSSFTYSLSLLSITTAVFFGKNIYNSLSSIKIILLILSLSTLGTLLSAYSDSIFLVWLGYGVFFGFANGIGYGYALQYSAIAMPDSKALMMGLVTSSYGLGATIAPMFYSKTILIGGFAHTMVCLTLVLFITNIIVLFLFKFSKINFYLGVLEEIEENKNSKNKFLLWIIYGLSIFSGLMCFGHAIGIARDYFFPTDYIYIIPIVMGLLNMTGGILFSSIVIKFSYRRIIIFLSFFNSSSLFLLYMIPSKIMVLFCLFIVSISYGGIISIFPSMINKIYGSISGIKIYGFVFTAWGFFGFLMPLIAGWTFDFFGSYSLVILFSSILSIFPLIIIKLNYKMFFKL